MTDEMSVPPVIAEAVKKAQIAWVTVDSKPAACLWCLSIEDAVYVVCGPGEQEDPGLHEVSTCVVTLRGDHSGRIVDYTATVVALSDQDESWTATAEAMAAKRLNATGDTVERWRGECTIYRLSPDADAEPRTGTGLSSDSLAASVVSTPAARPTRKPFRLHRVKKRRR